MYLLLNPYCNCLVQKKNEMDKIEHIGIAVKDLNAANKTYELLLGEAAYKEEIVSSENVKTSFFKVGESKIELLEGLGDDAISKFIEKRGEGLHHIAFAVDNIEEKMRELHLKGFKLLSDKPKKGADNKLVAFLHPKSASGVLVELCEDIKKGEG